MTRVSLVLLFALAACGGDDAARTSILPDAVLSCPVAQPVDGAACDLPAGDACTYFIGACACGPSDLEWSCGCVEGSWSCSRGYDCYPCPDAAVN